MRNFFFLWYSGTNCQLETSHCRYTVLPGLLCPVSKHCSVSWWPSASHPQRTHVYSSCDQWCHLAQEQLTNQTQRAEELTLQRLFYRGVNRRWLLFDLKVFSHSLSLFLCFKHFVGQWRVLKQELDQVWFTAPHALPLLPCFLCSVNLDKIIHQTCHAGWYVFRF